MKAYELLGKVTAGEAIPCDTCDDKVPASEVLRMAFKLGELAPRMENANVGSVVCVQCQINDHDIKVEPRDVDVKFVR